MAITEAYTWSSVSVTNVEKSITTSATFSTGSVIATAGVYQLWLDCSNMAKGDEFRVRLYEKVKSAGTTRVFQAWSLLGLQGENLVTPTFILMNGWDMTVIKIAGTDRTFDASIRKVA